MRLDLLVTIVLAALLGVVFFALVLRKRTSPSMRRTAALPPSSWRNDEAPITESPTYHRTKSPIASLRKSLDQAKDSVEHLAAALEGPESPEVDVARAMAHLREGLIGSFNFASMALAAVDEQPDPEPLAVEPSRRLFALPRPETEAARRVATVLKELGAAIEVCGPGIAGFYLSLTDQDERFRVVAAAEQMDRVLRVLERALKTLVILERELAA